MTRNKGNWLPKIAEFRKYLVLLSTDIFLVLPTVFENPVIPLSQEQ